MRSRGWSRGGLGGDDLAGLGVKDADLVAQVIDAVHLGVELVAAGVVVVDLALDGLLHDAQLLQALAELALLLADLRGLSSLGGLGRLLRGDADAQLRHGRGRKGRSGGVLLGRGRDGHCRGSHQSLGLSGRNDLRGRGRCLRRLRSLCCLGRRGSGGSGGLGLGGLTGSGRSGGLCARLLGLLRGLLVGLATGKEGLGLLALLALLLHDGQDGGLALGVAVADTGLLCQGAKGGHVGLLGLRVLLGQLRELVLDGLGHHAAPHLAELGVVGGRAGVVGGGALLLGLLLLGLRDLDGETGGRRGLGGRGHDLLAELCDECVEGGDELALGGRLGALQALGDRLKGRHEGEELDLLGLCGHLGLQGVEAGQECGDSGHLW
jgi:hypothetical protein